MSLERPHSALAVLAALVLLGLAVRGRDLGSRSLWFDEAVTWRLVELPFPEMLDGVKRDNHVPLYFVLLRGWVLLFGTSPVALRGLSVLLGGVTVWGAYLFTAEATRRRAAALLAAALVALSAFQIRWSWEARMYSLGTALAVLSGWALFRVLRAPAFRNWLLLGLLDLAFVYTHYYAFFTLVAQALFFVGYLLIEARGGVWQDRRLWPGLLTAGLVVAGWLPWMPIFLAQQAQVRADFWTKPLSAEMVGEGFCRILVAPDDIPYGPVEETAATLFYLAVLLALLWRARAAAWFVVLAAAVPVAACLLLSVVLTPLFVTRYLLFAQVYFLIGLALLLEGIPRPVPRRLLCTAAILASGASYLYYWHVLDFAAKPGSRAAAAFLDGRRRPGEPVVVASPLRYLPLLYYTDDRRGWYAYEPDTGIPHYEGATVLTPGERMRAARVRDLRARRVWVVNLEGGAWGERTVAVPTDWVLRERHSFTEPYAFQGQTIIEEWQPSWRTAPD
jgi:uncharacterized membrane protein